MQIPFHSIKGTFSKIHILDNYSQNKENGSHWSKTNALLAYSKGFPLFMGFILSKIWTFLEAEKKALSNENSEISPEEKKLLITIFDGPNNFIAWPDQAVDTLAYIRRFNILMSFMSDKEKVKMMLKENSEAFRDNEKMLFGPKFEEIVTKSLT